MGTSDRKASPAPRREKTVALPLLMLLVAALFLASPAQVDAAYDRVYVKAANGTGADRTLQVFFQTESSRNYSEDKSAKVTLPAGGGYAEVVANFSANAAYKGKIVALRVDPIDASGWFGIDYVYVGDSNRKYVYQAEFNGQTAFKSPFLGWTMHNIQSGWTDGKLWGGYGVNDPYFDNGNVSYNSGR